jgi:hypothetical protein
MATTTARTGNTPETAAMAPLPVESSTVVTTDRGAVVNSPPVAKEDPAPSGNQLTFSMFCRVRAIPIQRQAGMRAFTTINEATLSEWDALFKRY